MRSSKLMAISQNDRHLQRSSMRTMTMAVAMWSSDACTLRMAGACNPVRCAVDGLSKDDVDRDLERSADRLCIVGPDDLGARASRHSGKIFGISGPEVGPVSESDDHMLAEGPWS